MPKRNELVQILIFVLTWIATVAFCVLFMEDIVHAEPWLSNRFAQNCVGCHDSGRANRPFMDRRCSLSCQGCHTSPQGGGMRSLYGKWNENKWLTLARGDKEPGREVTFMKKILKTEDFEKEVPAGDPYWGQNGPEAGGDIRFLHPGKGEKAFMMSVALGVRWRAPRYLSLVMEPQYMGRPGTKFLWDMRPTGGTGYALISDLPMNSYLQAGQYRPLFGLNTPDHTAVPQRIFAEATTGTPRSQGLVFRSASAGMAPNVPYFNVHYIEGDSVSLATPDQRQRIGWAGNFGLRFVSLGLSMQYSFWDTAEHADVGESTFMQGFDMGMQLWRMTLNYYYLDALRRGEGEFSATSHYGEARLRIWREIYMEYFLADWTRDEEKQEQEQSWGLRIFPYPGWDVQLTQKKKGWMGQLHLFF